MSAGSPAGVGALPGGPLGRWTARMRAFVGWVELDASLAAGADVVAQLHLLVSDPLSPAYAGGGDPDRLAEVTAECLDALGAS